MAYHECNCEFCGLGHTTGTVSARSAFAATPTVMIIPAASARCTHNQDWQTVGEHVSIPASIRSLDFGGLRRMSDKDRLQGKLARVLGAKGQQKRRYK